LRRAGRVKRPILHLLSARFQGLCHPPRQGYLAIAPGGVTERQQRLRIVRLQLDQAVCCLQLCLVMPGFTLQSGQRPLGLVSLAQRSGEG
jgi:hypothetical protein